MSGWRERARSWTLSVGSALGAVCLLWTVGIVVAGVQPLVFLSGSMSPAINAGDVGFARPVPADQVVVGDVISVIASTGERVTHRVVAADPKGSSTTFRTKGDANNTMDAESYDLTSADRVVAVVPKLGHLLDFAASPWGIGIGAALIVACVWLGFTRPPARSAGLDESTDPAPPAEPAAVHAAGPSQSRTERHRPTKTMVALVPLTLAAVWLGATFSPAGSTLAYFFDNAKISSPTDGIYAAPWFTCAQSTNSASYGSQPWLHYNLNEAAGTQLTSATPFFQDDSGHGRHGIYNVGPLTTAVTPATGYGHACARDSTSNSVLFNSTSSLNAQFIREQSNSLTLNGGAGDRWNKFTINVWFKTNVAPGADKAGALAAYSVATGNIDAATDRVLYLDTNGYLRFEVYPGAYRFVTAPTNYADNKWHMATATLGSAGQCLYVDGAQVACDASTTSAFQTSSNAMYWRFGYATMSAGFLGITDLNEEQRAFHGMLDDVAIWTRQLSATEVRDLYRAGVPVI